MCAVGSVTSQRLRMPRVAPRRRDHVAIVAGVDRRPPGRTGADRRERPDRTAGGDVLHAVRVIKTVEGVARERTERAGDANACAADVAEQSPLAAECRDAGLERVAAVEVVPLHGVAGERDHHEQRATDREHRAARRPAGEREPTRRERRRDHERARKPRRGPQMAVDHRQQERDPEPGGGQPAPAGRAREHGHEWQDRQ